ncbi:unannotated protein [freshwater metagenome]|uniref:Unannotated protein n=1 Tax=freshwater metagenome TaxID=449393 RepID=A0A6J6G6F9_9ZZZZ
MGIKMRDFTTAADFMRSVMYATARPSPVANTGTNKTQIAVLRSTIPISGIVNAHR